MDLVQVSVQGLCEYLGVGLAKPRRVLGRPLVCVTVLEVRLSSGLGEY